jgi:hypothetical protein
MPAEPGLAGFFDDSSHFCRYCAVGGSAGDHLQ